MELLLLHKKAMMDLHQPPQSLMLMVQSLIPTLPLLLKKMMELPLQLLKIQTDLQPQKLNQLMELHSLLLPTQTETSLINIQKKPLLTFTKQQLQLPQISQPELPLRPQLMFQEPHTRLSLIQKETALPQYMMLLEKKLKNTNHTLTLLMMAQSLLPSQVMMDQQLQLTLMPQHQQVSLQPLTKLVLFLKSTHTMEPHTLPLQPPPQRLLLDQLSQKKVHTKLALHPHLEMLSLLLMKLELLLLITLMLKEQLSQPQLIQRETS